MEETGHKFERLKVEQSAFDARLDTLLQEHPGEFVVFKDQQPVWFFTSYDEAYSWAIDHFGLSDIFLVSEVKKRSDESVSISWQAGVLVSDI